MKKSVNPMDRLFKDTFASASDPIDSDALWPYVEENLPAKEPHKGFFFYFLSALIFLLLVLAAWVWFRDTPASLPINPKELAQQTERPASIVKASTLPQNKKLLSNTETPESSLRSAAYTDKWSEGSNSPAVKPTKSALSHDEPLFQDEASRIPGKEALNALASQPLHSLPLPMTFANVSLHGPGDPSWSRCSDKRTSRPGFLIEGFVFGGVPLISNQLNSSNSGEYGNYLSDWNQSETAVSTFSAGLLVGLETKWGGSISTGFEYQQIQNRLNQEQRITERITVYDEMAYFFIDSNNNRVYVADSVTTSRTYTREIQTAKTHTLINLPVLLGYHRQSGKFRYGIIGGVNFHLRNEFKGKALDASGQIIDAGSNSPNSIYRKDLNMSIIGGIDAGYMIGEGLELYVSPRFRFQGDSWLRADHPLVSRIQLIGLQTGVRLHL